MRSNEAWRNATDRFSTVIEEARSVIDQASGLMEGKLQKYLYSLLCDAYRTGVSIQVLVQQGLTDQRIPADSVEVLARQILERAIVSGYVRKQDPDEMVDRWRKTRALEWKERWGESVDPEAENLPVKRLPDYRQMAEKVGSGKLWEAYRQYSYLSHPRGVCSYTEVEWMSGLGSQEFFRGRVQEALRGTSAMLTMLTGNFCESQNAK